MLSSDFSPILQLHTNLGQSQSRIDVMYINPTHFYLRLIPHLPSHLPRFFLVNLVRLLIGSFSPLSPSLFAGPKNSQFGTIESQPGIKARSPPKFGWPLPVAAGFPKSPPPSVSISQPLSSSFHPPSSISILHFGIFTFWQSQKQRQQQPAIGLSNPQNLFPFPHLRRLLILMCCCLFLWTFDLMKKKPPYSFNPPHSPCKAIATGKDISKQTTYSIFKLLKIKCVNGFGFQKKISSGVGDSG